MKLTTSQLRKIIIKEVNGAAEAEIALQKIRAAIGGRVALMESRGYSVQQRNDYVFKTLIGLENGQLNEGLFDAIGSAANMLSNNKLLQPLQNWLGKKITKLIGIDPNSFMGLVVVNFIENLEISKLKKMLSGRGACRPFVEELAGALQETMVEKGLQKLGLAPTGMFGKMVQETLQAAFVEDGPFVRFATDKICSINISSFFSAFKGKKPSLA